MRAGSARRARRQRSGRRGEVDPDIPSSESSGAPVWRPMRTRTFNPSGQMWSRSRRCASSAEDRLQGRRRRRRRSRRRWSPPRVPPGRRPRRARCVSLFRGRRRSGAGLLDEPRGALDVGEEEGDGAGRKRGGHPQESRSEERGRAGATRLLPGGCAVSDRERGRRTPNGNARTDASATAPWALDREGAVQRRDPVREPAQARARRRIGAADAVVGDLHGDDAVVGVDPDDSLCRRRRT